MRFSQQEHNEEHNELMRLLVEGELEGRRKRAAERRLLSCPGCLTEYNGYYKFWTLVTSAAFHKRQAEHLRQSDAEAHRHCAEAMEALAAAPTRPATRRSWRSGFVLSLLHRPALGAVFVILVVLTLSYVAYRSIPREADRQRQGRVENQALSEAARAEIRKDYEDQIAALTRKTAELSQPDTAAVYVIIPEMQRGPDVEYPPVKLTDAVKFLVLTINLQSDYARHTIEIADTARENLWHKSGVATRTGSLSLVIPKEFFKKDRYIVSVYGEIDHDEKKLISEFPLRIAGSADLNQ
jgi:hypothetical protein